MNWSMLFSLRMNTLGIISAWRWSLECVYRKKEIQTVFRCFISYWDHVVFLEWNMKEFHHDHDETALDQWSKQDQDWNPYETLSKNCNIVNVWIYSYLLKFSSLLPKEYAGIVCLVGSCIWWPQQWGSLYLPGPGPIGG